VVDYFRVEEQELMEKVASADRCRSVLERERKRVESLTGGGLRPDTRSVVLKAGNLSFVRAGAHLSSIPSKAMHSMVGGGK
jgi:hypothetical protein